MPELNWLERIFRGHCDEPSCREKPVIRDDRPVTYLGLFPLYYCKKHALTSVGLKKEVRVE